MAAPRTYALPLHDALPISTPGGDGAIRYHVLFAAAPSGWVVQDYLAKIVPTVPVAAVTRSEEHTSELQSHSDLVCRLLLEKKNSTYEACSGWLCGETIGQL